MPDLLGFSVVRNGTVTLNNAPTWLISGRIVSSKDQSVVLQDFTGANAVSFPQVLGNFSAAQQDDFVAKVVNDLLSKRFGLF